MSSVERNLQENANETESMQRENDYVDTTPILKPSSTNDGTISTALPTFQNPEHLNKYNMHHKRRGIALIFNHKNFPEGLNVRHGADEDGLALNKILSSLNFDVRSYMDLTSREVRQIIYDVSKEDHRDADCILVAVMSHGTTNGIILSSDGTSYAAENIWKAFTADQVPSLAGKPKIFLYQFCRGPKMERGLWVNDTGEMPAPKEIVFTVPVNADFLILHSTMDGYVSLRHPENGTFLIQDFCREMEKHASERDFVQILTLVLRRVATEFKVEGMAQMPEFTSTLTKLIYF